MISVRPIRETDAESFRAALDAVARERKYLARAEAPPSMAPNAWLEVFRRDMQGVLLAELDVRFLPLEGLLAAGSSAQD